MLCFRYLSVGLPALDGVEYLEGGDAFGAAMAALMRVPPDRRAWFKAEALQRIGEQAPDKFRGYLLAECVDAYIPLRDEAEQQEFQRILTDSEYEEAKTMTAPTIFEEGLQQGRIVGQREILLLLLKNQFGSQNESVRQRIEQMSGDELQNLARQFVHARSLAELGLDS
jgi:hypothetical protein